MNIRTLILLFLNFIVFEPMRIHAQQGYYAYEESGRSYGTTAVLPAEDGSLFIAVGDHRYPNQSLAESSPARIIKLSKQCEEIANIQLSDDEVYSLVVNMFPDPANNKLFYAIGKIYDLESQCEKPCLVHLDGSLNILAQSVIDLPDECRYLTEIRTLLADDNCIYWVSSYQTQFPNMIFQESAQIYMKINLDGTLVQKLQDMNQPCWYCITGDIFPYQDGSGDFGHLYTTVNSFPGAHNILKRFTRDLQLSVVFEADGITPVNEPYGDCMYSVFPPEGYQSTLTLPDGKLIYSDQAVEAIWGDGCEDWNQMCSPIFKIDLDLMQIQQYQIIGRENDSTEMVWNVHAVDLNSHGDLFHCCNAIPGVQSIYTFPKRIMVTKTDVDLNVVWQKSFWFDGTRCSYGVKATEDGGCLVYGSTIRNESGSETRSAFVFKLDSDGLMYLPENADEPRPFAYWPNPVKDRLQLRFSTDFQPVKVDLYDLQGRLVHTQSDGFERVDVNCLPLGTYMMRVTLEDGTVFSDKLIKE